MLLNQSKMLLTATIVTALCGCATAEEVKVPGVMGKPVPPGESALDHLEPGGGIGVVGFAPQTSAMPISAYMVNLRPALLEAKGRRSMNIEPQLLFIDETSAKKAFEKKDEIQKTVMGIIKKSRVDLTSSAGKFLIKGEIMAKLNEAGYAVEGVLWNAIRL